MTGTVYRLPLSPHHIYRPGLGEQARQLGVLLLLGVHQYPDVPLGDPGVVESLLEAGQPRFEDDPDNGEDNGHEHRALVGDDGHGRQGQNGLAGLDQRVGHLGH